MGFVGWREWDADNCCRGRIVDPNEEYFPCWCTNCYTMFNDVDDLDEDDAAAYEEDFRVCPNCRRSDGITYAD